MTDSEREVNEAGCSRRRFMLAATVGTAATATAGTAVAQEDENDDEDGAEDTDENGNDENGNDENGAAATGNEEPDYEGWLDDAPNYTQTEDLRGEDEVEVGVGTGPEGLEYEPPAIWIDPGTTVVWEWTGEGGSHDVSADSGPADLSSDLTDEAGFTYEHTFEEEGITTYYCSPHITVGMKGSVAVGDDIPTVEIDDDPAALEPHEMGVQIQEHWVGVGAVLMLAVSIVFSFYALKYGESPHASHGGDQ